MNNKLKRLINSFRYAFHGIGNCIRYERNFRIHMVVALYVIAAAVAMQVSRVEFCVLVLTIGNVLVMEMLNTAVEKTVDLSKTGINHTAKIAKDVAAGAVLVSAIISIVIGAALLLRWDRLLTLLGMLTAGPFLWIALVISAVLAIWFIFAFPDLEERTVKKERE